MGKIPTPTKPEKGKKVDWSEEMNDVAEQKQGMPTPCTRSNAIPAQPAENSEVAADQDPSSPSSNGGDVFQTACNSPQLKSQATSLASGSSVMKGNEDMNGNGTSPGFGNRTDHFGPVLAEIKAKLDKTQQCSRPESLVETPEDVQRDAERRRDNLVVSSQPKKLEPEKLEPKKLNPGVPAFVPVPPAVNTESVKNGSSNQTNGEERKKTGNRGDQGKNTEDAEKQAAKNKGKNAKRRERKREKAQAEKEEQFRQKLANVKARNEFEYDPDKPKVDSLLESLTSKAGGKRRNSIGNFGTNKFPEIPEDLVRTRSFSFLGGLEKDLVTLSEDLVEKVYEALKEKFGAPAS